MKRVLINTLAVTMATGLFVAPEVANADTKSNTAYSDFYGSVEATGEWKEEYDPNFAENCDKQRNLNKKSTVAPVQTVAQPVQENKAKSFEDVDLNNITIHIHLLDKDTKQEYAVEDAKPIRKMSAYGDKLVYNAYDYQNLNICTEYVSSVNFIEGVTEYNITRLVQLAGNPDGNYSWWVDNKDGTWSYMVANGVLKKDGEIGFTVNENGQWVHHSYAFKDYKMVTGWNQDDHGFWSYYQADGERLLNGVVDGYTIVGGHMV